MLLVIFQIYVQEMRPFPHSIVLFHNLKNNTHKFTESKLMLIHNRRMVAIKNWVCPLLFLI